MTFQILRPNISSRVCTSIVTSLCTCSSSTLCTELPCFIAFVRLTRPNRVRLYQYCCSHHAGDTKSVTLSGFLWRKRSRGARGSSPGCSGAVEAATAASRFSPVAPFGVFGSALRRCVSAASAIYSRGRDLSVHIRENAERLTSEYSISICGPRRESLGGVSRAHGVVGLLLLLGSTERSSRTVRCNAGGASCRTGSCSKSLSRGALG